MADDKTDDTKKTDNAKAFKGDSPAAPTPDTQPELDNEDDVPATSATIQFEDHEIVEVDVEGAPDDEAIMEVGDISAADLDRLKKILAEESARRGAVQPRPFEHFDLESLLILGNQIRAEVASR